MKLNKYILGLCLAALSLATTYAQDSISVNFAIVIPETSKLTASQRLELKEKLERIIARTNTSGPIDETPFVIVPNLVVTYIKQTEGTLCPLMLAKGELSLFVKNRYDGSIYNQLTVQLQNTFEGNQKENAALQLIRSIPWRDTRFVRFIKTSKKRILEKYANDAIVIPY